MKRPSAVSALPSPKTWPSSVRNRGSCLRAIRGLRPPTSPGGWRRAFRQPAVRCDGRASCRHPRSPIFSGRMSALPGSSSQHPIILPKTMASRFSAPAARSWRTRSSATSRVKSQRSRRRRGLIYQQSTARSATNTSTSWSRAMPTSGLSPASTSWWTRRTAPDQPSPDRCSIVSALVSR